MSDFNGGKNQYDIGLVYRSNHNYGACMTHYALYHLLSDKGYSVLMIDLYRNSSLYLPLEDDNPWKLFSNPPYPEYAVAYTFEHKWQYEHLNESCFCFAVGSDQLWRNYFLSGTDDYSTLDWTWDSKFRFSYATSFGQPYFEGCDGEKERFGKKVSRFHRISVREESGVEIIQKLTGKEATVVLDPVFMCKAEVYDNLISSVPPQNTAYIGTYILDDTEKKEKIVNLIADRLQLKNIVVIKDAMTVIGKSRKVEDWLSMIYNANFVVTDSFHGMCFALIFHKQFVVTLEPQSHRGFERIENLLKRIGLEKRVIGENDSIEKLLDEKINYAVIEKSLNELKKESMEWLNQTLEMAESYNEKQKGNVFKQELDEKKYEYEKKINEVRCKIDNIAMPQDEIILWGAGCCFRKTVKILAELYNITKVIDNDAQKWGRKYLMSQIVCYSPAIFEKNLSNSTVIILMENLGEITKISEYLQQKGARYITYAELFETNKEV